MRNREENKASKQYRKRQKQEGGGVSLKWNPARAAFTSVPVGSTESTRRRLSMAGFV